MKLVVEKMRGTFYCYLESEKHFKRVQRQRIAKKSTRLDPQSLDGECYLDKYGDDFHIVFDVKT